MPEPSQAAENRRQEPQSTAVLCLVRVAAHYGLTLDAEQLTRGNPFDSEEPSPALVLKMAESAGLRGKLTCIKRGELARFAAVVPAILLLPNGKTAVINRVQQVGGATFALLEEFETGRGLSALCDEPRLFECWAGAMILLKPRWRPSGAERPFGFAWLLDQVLMEWRLFRDIGLAAFLISVLSLLPPMTFMLMMDRVLTNHSESTLEVLGVALAAVIVFETAFGYLRRYLTWLAASRIDARLNLYVFDKLLNLPMSFFERNPTGMINAKLGQIWHIREFLTNQLFGTLLDSVTLFVLLPVLFILNWQLTFLVMALAAGMMGIYIAFLPSLASRHAALIRAEQAMASHQVETIHGIRTVKSLSLDGMKRRQRDQRVAEVIEKHQALDRLSNFPQTLATPLERLIYIGSFFFGCYMALDDPNGSTMGRVVAFAMLAGRVTAPVVQMANMINSFQHARGAMYEVASVMNVTPEGGRTGTGLRLPISGRIVFENVRFRYSPTAQYALDGVSFAIPQGTICGVMGRSGSGKTTVARLLQGLNREYEGLIKIDGMDLREIDLDHLRSRIGVVPQENFLFSGTIRDNIGAARPKSSFDKIVRAAQLAGAEEFIERLPNGYETAVEEGAVNFSGGQRQRLAIARALLVDPPILILDEATSALDAESEAIVNANLRRIARNRTVIIISHRLSSLSMADTILVLERGRLYDSGRHDQLIARCDIYRSLWSQQNRHLETEDQQLVRSQASSA